MTGVRCLARGADDALVTWHPPQHHVIGLIPAVLERALACLDRLQRGPRYGTTTLPEVCVDVLRHTLRLFARCDTSMSWGRRSPEIGHQGME